jgi:hypothetical protein
VEERLVCYEVLMRDRLLLGAGRYLIPVPGFVWRRVVRANGNKTKTTLGFMSPDHHRVRDFTVTELARTGKPLTVECIAERLDIDVARVASIVDELEKRLTFLYRSRGDAVTWAYPVTVDETPHRAVLSSGEEAYSP